MYAIMTFLVVGVITMVFTQIATGALIATGTPPRVAAFQARSALSGAGFTTTESENVVNHPARRRIIAASLFVGALGTPTLVVTVLLGLVAPGPGSTTERTLVAIAGLFLLVVVVLNRPMTRLLERVGQHYAQARLLPSLEAAGQELLALGDGFVVAVASLGDEPTAAPRSLRGLDLALSGVKVLAVQRGRELVTDTPADFTLHAGDELIVFGRRDQLVDLGMLDQRDR
ncbi:MAG: TrkA C-terminal domain-containing protein [Acidimicrobiia bacterium]|nr:TrkA C-terminal domain-containing protein [Acidimicrobiia bacterium]